MLQIVDTIVADRLELQNPNINLLALYQLCTNLGHAMSLSMVWETFHPNKVKQLRWHDAQEDALH